MSQAPGQPGAFSLTKQDVTSMKPKGHLVVVVILFCFKGLGHSVSLSVKLES